MSLAVTLWVAPKYCFKLLLFNSAQKSLTSFMNKWSLHTSPTFTFILLVGVQVKGIDIGFCSFILQLYLFDNHKRSLAMDTRLGQKSIKVFRENQSAV